IDSGSGSGAHLVQERVQVDRVGQYRIVADTRSFASVGKLLGSGARAAMLHLLMDGTHHTARELANHAGVAPSTASAHLSALVKAASSPSSAKVGGVTFSYRPGGSGRLGIVERPGRCARSCLFSSAGNHPTPARYGENLLRPSRGGA